MDQITNKMDSIFIKAHGTQMNTDTHGKLKLCPPIGGESERGIAMLFIRVYLSRSVSRNKIN